MPVELKVIPLFGSHFIEWGAGAGAAEAAFLITEIKTAGVGAFGSIVELNDTNLKSHVCAAYRSDGVGSFFRVDLSAILRQYFGLDLNPLPQLLGQPNPLTVGESVPFRMATKYAGVVIVQYGAITQSFAFAPWRDFGDGFTEQGATIAAAMTQGYPPATWATKAPAGFWQPVAKGELIYRGLHTVSPNFNPDIRATWYNVAGNQLGYIDYPTTFSELEMADGYPRTMTHYRLSEVVELAPAGTDRMTVVINYQDNFVSQELRLKLIECKKSVARPRLHWINSRGGLDSYTFSGATTFNELSSAKVIHTTRANERGNNIRRLTGSNKVGYACTVEGNNDFWAFISDAGNSSACWLEMETPDGLPAAEVEQNYLVPCSARWTGDIARYDSRKPTRAGTLSIELNPSNLVE
jgi:hypothetical protein